MKPLRIAGISAAVIAGLMALMVLSSALGIFGNVLGVADRVTDPDRMLFRYEHFFDMCASVQAFEDQAGNLQAQLDATPEDDTRELNRLRSALTAVQSQRARVIADYNADATAHTRRLFHDNRLPDRLNVNAEETTCAL